MTKLSDINILRLAAIAMCLIALTATVQSADAFVLGDIIHVAQASSVYGEKNPVNNEFEARKAVDKFIEGRAVSIKRISEKKLFFEAEIQDKSGKVVDIVIIDKRTGRVRSVY